MMKTILGAAAGLASQQVIENIVKVTTPENLMKTQKVLTKIGGVVIGAMVSSKVAEHIGTVTDEVIDMFKKPKKEVIMDIQPEEEA